MKKNNIINSSILLVITTVYVLLVRFYDYRAIGVNNSYVGFGNLNGAFNRFTGTHLTLDTVSDIILLLFLIMALGYAIVGLIQLIKRKSIKKVDKSIIVLGCFYVLMVIIYFGFEKLHLNYRPILIDGKLDPSFPSTHVLVSLFIGVSGILINKELFKKPLIINIIITLLIVLMIVIRTISGMHWLTDIVGALLIDSTLLYIFYSLITYQKTK